MVLKKFLTLKVIAAAAGVRHLMLLGRSGRGEIGTAAFGDASVTLRRCDVSSREEVNTLFLSGNGKGAAACLSGFLLHAVDSSLCIFSIFRRELPWWQLQGFCHRASDIWMGLFDLYSFTWLLTATNSMYWQQE